MGDAEGSISDDRGLFASALRFALLGMIPLALKRFFYFLLTIYARLLGFIVLLVLIYLVGLLMHWVLSDALEEKSYLEHTRLL